MLALHSTTCLRPTQTRCLAKSHQWFPLNSHGQGSMQVFIRRLREPLQWLSHQKLSKHTNLEVQQHTHPYTKQHNNSCVVPLGRLQNRRDSGVTVMAKTNLSPFFQVSLQIGYTLDFCMDNKEFFIRSVSIKEKQVLAYITPYLLFSLKTKLKIYVIQIFKIKLNYILLNTLKFKL